MTKSDLETQVSIINNQLDTDAYFLSGAYGGYALFKVNPDGSGESIFGAHGPAKLLSLQMSAYMLGIAVGISND